MTNSIIRSQLHGAGIALTVAKVAMRFMVAVALAINASARGVRSAPVPELCKLATVVVVGEVESIKQSGIETHLSYPTVDRVTFKWLQVRVKVLASLKGEASAKHIDVAMLAAPKGEGMVNGPLMLEPMKGQNYVMFLVPSSKQDLLVSLFAPYDEQNAVFLLDRAHSRYDMSGISTSVAAKNYRDAHQEIRDMVWSIVDAKGKIQAEGIEKFRKHYQRELQEPASAKAVALEWEKFTNKAGWSVDVPKGLPQTNKEPKDPGPAHNP